MDITHPKQVQILVEALDSSGDSDGARSVCERFIAENENSTKPPVLDALEFALRKLIALNEWRKVVSPRQFIDAISPLYDRLVVILFSREQQNQAVREWTNKGRAIAEFDTDEALAVFDSIIQELPTRRVSIRYAGLYVYRERLRNTPSLEDSHFIRNAMEYGSALNASISEMYNEPDFEIDPTADSDMWLFGELLKVKDLLLAGDHAKKALSLLTATLEHLDRNHDPSFFRVVEKAIAGIHVREDDLLAAIAVLEPSYFSQAAAELDDLDAYEEFFDTAELIGDCYSRLKNPRKALMVLRDAVSFAIEHLNALDGISPLISRLIFTCHERAAELDFTRTSKEYLTILIRHYKDSEEPDVAALVEDACQQLKYSNSNTEAV